MLCRVNMLARNILSGLRTTQFTRITSNRTTFSKNGKDKDFNSGPKVSSKVINQNASIEDMAHLAVPYKDFDVLISDIDEHELQEIGAANQIENLSLGTFSPTPFPVLGRIHGRNLRLMAPLACKNYEKENAQVFNIWFLIDTGSPYTCVTVKSLEKLIGMDFTHHLHNIQIQDSTRYVECQISKGHFAYVNILGMDAIQQLELSLEFDWKQSKNTFYLTRK